MSIEDNTTKTCNFCKKTYPLGEFGKDKNSKDGISWYCKYCNRERAKKWREQNRDRARARDAAYAAANREQARDRARKWRLENLDRDRENTRRWQENNRDRAYANQRAWRASNPEKVKQYSRTYWENNRDKYQHQKALRRASELQATPAWVDANALSSIYAKAARLRAAGQDVHVDHIVPLRGKNVCGLHVPWNLQIIPASDNLRKGNRLHPPPH